MSNLNYWQEKTISNSTAIDVLDKQILTANQSIAILQAGLTANDTAISTLQGDVTTLSSAISANTTAISTINTALSDITQQPTAVNHVDNTYTLNIDNKPSFDFSVTSADANAKTIALSNIPAFTQIAIDVICTTTAAFTWPWLAARWSSGAAPTFATGKRYKILAWTEDGGTNWYAANVKSEGWTI
jgi:short subunit dehydrogenase-like uncharacterized protein